MEDLTKTQLILLALLVSFITSIATGIVTITLLDQAPPSVTQTINRVVERTVEKVVPGQAASVITKETTLVIKEENLIIDAVEKNSKSLVRIGFSDKESEYGGTLGVGVVVLSDGSIVTDALNLTDSKEYLIKTSSGKVYLANLKQIDLSSGVAVLKATSSIDGSSLPKFNKPSFGKTSDLKLGQTVIGIGGLSENSVLTGIVSKLNKKVITVPSSTGEKDDKGEVLTTEIKVLDSIGSSLAFSSDYSGGPLIDVDGFLLGINIKRKDGDFSVPIDTVLDIVAGVSDNVVESQKQEL